MFYSSDGEYEFEEHCCTGLGRRREDEDEDRTEKGIECLIWNRRRRELPMRGAFATEVGNGVAGDEGWRINFRRRTRKV